MPGLLTQIGFWLATWGGSGLMRPAPGTWGSIAALPCAWLVLWVSPLAFPFAIILVFGVGLWASHVYMESSGTHDPGEIVIDEVAGQWIVLLPLMGSAFNLLDWFVALVLFRIFDILKPWPVSWADRQVSGPMGVMLDDVIAGIMGAFVMAGYVYVFR